MLSGDSGGELKATHRRLRLKFDEAFYDFLRLETIKRYDPGDNRLLR